MPALAAKDLAAWTGGRWVADPAGPVTAVAVDSRTLPPGALFVALRGERHDGHDYLAQAMAAGAAAAMVERGRGPPEPGPWLEVDDCRRGLIDLARRYRAGWPGFLLGITGSVGKTTVKELLAAMLARAGATARTHLNWNTDIGLPLSLLRANWDDRFGVFELGTNHPGEIAALAEILRPQAAVLTPIGAAHLEYFGSEAAIAREKSMLPASLPADGWAVLDADDRWFGVLADAAPCRVITVSQHPGASFVWRAHPPGGWEVREAGEGGWVRFEGGPAGRFFQLDATLAVAAARQVGVGWGDLREVVRQYRSPAMRWEPVRLGDILFINDGYNANPLSMRAALQAFGETPVRGRRWLVLGAMRELGDTARTLHLELGRWVATGPWAGLVAYGEWGAVLAEGARDQGMADSRIRLCATPSAVVDALRGWLRPGDAVLLKASRSERLEGVLSRWSLPEPRPAQAAGHEGT